MCGIAGIVQCFPRPVKDLVQQMTDALAHRGPDGEGMWISPLGRATLGHRRLAIIDLSEAARQPMQYLNRYQIVFNGEIYNHIELRKTLEKNGYSFRTRSDTEVLLAAYDFYGHRFVEKLDGMFALGIWDEEKQQLTAARDRFGEKPFYYFINNDRSQLYFASEPKAFRKAGVDMSICEEALFGFLAENDADHSLQNTRSFYQKILQLPPGHCMTVDCSLSILQVSIHDYRPKRVNSEEPVASDREVSDKFLLFLQDSIKKRLRSDVPIGTSFSGGLDSASIAAVLNSMNNENTSFSHQAFIAGFPGFEKDETDRAAALAKTFHLKCHLIQPNEKSFAEEIVSVIKHHEEPISSASVYAQFKVYEKAAQEGIKVLIDGQGADELLAGYDHYMHWFLQELIRKGAFVPFLKEKNALESAGRLKEWTFLHLAAAYMPGWTARLRSANNRRKVKQNKELNSEFVRAHINGRHFETPVVRQLNDLLHWSSTIHGLPELLRYADRNAMAHGREVRLPFLQPDLAKWLMQLPATFKIRNGYSKWILRKSLESSLPANVVWQKQKIGFEPPQFSWMQQLPIQERISASRELLVKEKYLAPSVLQKKIRPAQAYSADNYDWRYLVAGVLLE